MQVLNASISHFFIRWSPRDDTTLKRLRNPLIQLIMETSEQSSNTEDTDLLPNFQQGENDKKRGFRHWTYKIVERSYRILEHYPQPLLESTREASAAVSPQIFRTWFIKARFLPLTPFPTQNQSEKVKYALQTKCF